MYAIQATAILSGAGDGSTCTRQVPTFYLHENVQGIVSEDHATRIALDILRSGSPANVRFHVRAVYVGQI